MESALLMAKRECRQYEVWSNFLQFDLSAGILSIDE